MTFSAIKDAMRSLRQLYIDSKEVEVLFLDELTETIEVRYIKTGTVTTPVFYDTKSESIEEKEIPSGLVWKTHTCSAYARKQATTLRCKRRFRADTTSPATDGSLSKTKPIFAH